MEGASDEEEEDEPVPVPEPEPQPEPDADGQRRLQECESLPRHNDGKNPARVA